MDEKSSETAIKVVGLSKVFKLPHEKRSSIKSAFVSFFRRQSYEKQKVLNDISFDIKQGEFFGIVGRNGSGKSTLLKLLAGIYSPTSGEVTVNGKLTPFIELGVGFNPELTGRENVFLNGALLGFNRKEMEKMYDEIVEFAELKKFMDQKLKNYSSGMQVRLAFSIAIRAKSDILILDEVLAVGDESFQKKCIDVFEKYKAERKTVVLVTHDMETIRRFCNKAILLDSGRIVTEGDPSLTATKYSKLNMNKEADRLKKQKNINSLSIEIKKSRNNNFVFESGERMTICLSWPSSVKGVMNIGIAIIKNSGEFIYGPNTLSLLNDIKDNKVTYQVELPLTSGKYNIKAAILGKTKYDIIDFVEEGPEFIMYDDPDDRQTGLVRLKDKWKV